MAGRKMVPAIALRKGNKRDNLKMRSRAMARATIERPMTVILGGKVGRGEDEERKFN